MCLVNKVVVPAAGWYQPEADAAQVHRVVLVLAQTDALFVHCYIALFVHCYIQCAYMHTLSHQGLCELAVQKGITAENSAAILHTSDDLRASRLRDICMRFVVRHFDTVSKSEVCIYVDYVSMYYGMYHQSFLKCDSLM